MKDKEVLSFRKTLNILYVEDDNTLRESMTEMLGLLFNSVESCKDGLEGYNKYSLSANGHYDFILSDISMPNMDGIEMSKKIREISEDIPIMFLTAFDEKEYFLESIRLGIDEYILKPIQHNSFINKINKVVKKLYLIDQNNKYKESLEVKIEEQTKELKFKNIELNLKYFHDSLTGLQNRYAMAQNIVLYKNPKMLLVDINKFSTINNIYGGKVGDKVLKEVARRLLKFEKTGCVVYRISSDQFVLIQENLPENSFESIIKEILDVINNSVFIVKIDKYEVDINITVTASMVKDVKPTKLLEYADMTLKYAKLTHQPYAIYTPELKVKKNYQKALDAVNLVKVAISEDNLVPYFQPIVKKEGTTYECLVRIEKGKDTISPFFFIDDIKHTSYYTTLTKTMIDKSFEYFKDKSNSFSINLSFEDILNTHIIGHIKDKLKKTNMNNQLILEILESESIDNFEKVKEFIKEMKELGVRIAIDDFGSGYSNFSYLNELNPDFLKIDGSLIKDIDTNEKSYIIVKTIVAFAKELGIRTIAEFIHSDEVYQKVIELDIDGHQGYFLGEPRDDIS